MSDVREPIVSPPQLFPQIAGLFVRHGFTLLSGWFVAHGILAKDDADSFVNWSVAGALAALAVGWSVTSKALARQAWWVAFWTDARPGSVAADQVAGSTR